MSMRDNAVPPASATPEVPPPNPEGRHPHIGRAGFAGRDDIFFAAVELTRMPMIVTDPNQPDNPIVFANEAFTHMCGYGPEELIGRNCRFLQGPETNPDTVAAIKRAVQTRQDFATEILNYRKDGSSFWNALFVSPVYDHEDRLLYFFGSQLDVSRRRDAEDALRQAQKMEAVGQLTGGLAHDFNNLLTVVTGNIENAMARVTDPAALKSLDRALQATERGAQLTQQLLAFARKQRLDGRAVNLNQLVEGLHEIVGRTLGHSVEFHTRLDPDLWTCRVDPVQAETALLNVLINARDAMPDGGRVTIATANRTIEEDDSQAHGGLAAGDYVCMSVTDNGPGMAPEVLKRATEPFFTTKEVGKGSGMGLAMVYGFARQSRGHLSIYSEPGQGTTVRLFFPVVDEAGGQFGGRRQTERGGGAETVLIVEDNAEVLELAEGILGGLGYRVLTATNGKEALQALAGAAHVDLLFTDVVMPGGMNGVTLAKEAQGRYPRLAVLLTTGFAEGTGDGASEAAGYELIDKPYRRAALARKIREVLDRRNAKT
jgi:PAS domain S-box-containing protein